MSSKPQHLHKEQGMATCVLVTPFLEFAGCSLAQDQQVALSQGNKNRNKISILLWPLHRVYTTPMHKHARAHTYTYTLTFLKVSGKVLLPKNAYYVTVKPLTNGLMDFIILTSHRHESRRNQFPISQPEQHQSIIMLLGAEAYGVLWGLVGVFILF